MKTPLTPEEQRQRQRKQRRRRRQIGQWLFNIAAVIVIVLVIGVFYAADYGFKKLTCNGSPYWSGDSFKCPVVVITR